MPAAQIEQGPMMPDADVRIVGMAGLQRNYPELIAQALRQRGLHCETYSIPFMPMYGCTPSVLRKLKSELGKASPSTVSIYCAGLGEYYISEADVSVHFSAYRRWFKPQRMRVIAHPWTNVEPTSIEHLKWTGKPPLTAGFMGTGYCNSRLGGLVSKSPFKGLVLRGHHLRIPGILATLNAFKLPCKGALTFPRPEALSALENCHTATGIDVRNVDTGGFTGSREQVAQYERHMRNLTYVLCPRGLENFSFRFYEALKFGKVPVLVDTDVVLPDGVDWDELIIRVPYAELSNIGHFIARDHERRSAAQFKKRQEKAFEVMENLAGGRWADELVRDVRRHLAHKADAAAVKSLRGALGFWPPAVPNLGALRRSEHPSSSFRHRITSPRQG